MVLLFVHFLTSEPPDTGSWNTPAFEIARFFSLHAFMLLPFYINQSNRLKNVSAPSSIITFIGLFMCFIAVLQVLGILPHYYFQWHEGFHLPRPTGGFTHPHFFCGVLLICIANIYHQYNSRRITRRKKNLYIILFLSGAIISTSTVGIIMVFSGWLFIEYQKIKNLLIFFIKHLPVLFFLMLLVVVIMGIWYDNLEESRLYLFYSAFTDKVSTLFDFGTEDFLNKRGDLWRTEIELISASLTTTFFGHGYQPFVSHNLILRQCQVTGVLGAFSYLVGIVLWVKYVMGRLGRKNRAVFLIPVIGLTLGSITFPVLVSIPIALMMSLFSVLLIQAEKNEWVRRSR